MNLKALLSVVITSYVTVYNAQSARVDGGWSPWSKYPTECSAPCGGGQQNFSRSCTNPAPFGDGLYCPGSNIDCRSCNTEACKTSWSQWSGCNVTCDIGGRSRRTLCGDQECTGSQLIIQSQECVDWNIKTCPGPCTNNRCPTFAKCVDLSNTSRPIYRCDCVMGYEMNAKQQCTVPSPAPPLPRPIPTLNEVQKTVVIVITRTASTILLIMVGITLLIFMCMRIFTVDRIIQMNMELALECAHLLLLFPNTMAEDNPNTCRIISMGLQFFYIGSFSFTFLESVHMYSLVASVVQKNGLLTRFQNVLIGWGISAIILLFSICFNYSDYGAQYHCWLRMDTPLLYAQFIPAIVLIILTFLMTEAAGNADYALLENVSRPQLFSAKISQRTNFILLGLIFASWILGIMSDYEQNLALYSSFSICNAIIGFGVFFVHSLGNQEVRRKLKQCFECFVNKLKRT